MRCGTYLGNIERRDIGTQSNRHTSDDPPHDKRRKGKCPPSEDRGNSKEQRGDEQNRFAPVAIAKSSCNQRAYEASDKRAAVCPPHSCRTAKMKINFKKLTCPTNYNPVIS